MAQKRRRRTKASDEPTSMSNISVGRYVPQNSEDFIKKLRGTSAQHEAEEVWLISYADLMTLLMGFFALLLSFSEFKEESFEKVKEQTSEFFGGEYTVPYEKFAEKLRKFSQDQNIQDKFAVENGPGGVTISFRGSLVFSSAKSSLNSTGQQILSQVLPIIKEDPQDFNIVIEGHTDNVPIKTPSIRNNWDLSGLRASTVAEVFQNLGFAKTDIRLVSFADTRPVAPNVDESGQGIPENQAKNRRVVIKLIPKPKVSETETEASIESLSDENNLDETPLSEETSNKNGEQAQ